LALLLESQHTRAQSLTTSPLPREVRISPRLSKHKKKLEPTTQNDVYGTLLSDPRLISRLLLLLQRPDITCLNLKLPEMLESEEVLKAKTQNGRIGTDGDRERLDRQPDFKLNVLTASFADLPQH